MNIDQVILKLREARRMFGDKVEVKLQVEGIDSEFSLSLFKPKQDPVVEGKPKPAVKPDYLIIVKN